VKSAQPKLKHAYGLFQNYAQQQSLSQHGLCTLVHYTLLLVKAQDSFPYMAF